MKTLVVYYSRTGRTKTVAETLAQQLQCDSEEIIDTKKRDGTLGFIISGRHAMKKKPAILKPIQKDPALYDLVLIGTPIWVKTISTPIRTYIEEQKNKFKAVGFFSTYGDTGAEAAFTEMQELCGKQPLGVFACNIQDVETGEFNNKINRFITVLHSTEKPSVTDIH